MKITLLSIITFIAITLSAQSHRFADSTAQWYMTTYNIGFGCGGCFNYHTDPYNILGETTIGMQVYQNINGTLVRADSTRKVYRYFDNEEIMIYDFGKNAGDTFTLMNPFGEGWVVHYRVDSTDTILLNYPRKRMYVTYRGVLSSRDVWIEGVGSLRSNFLNPAVEVLPYDGPTYNLRCFFEYDSLLLHTDAIDNRCNLDSTWVSINEVELISANITPNPATNHLTITLSQQPYQVTTLLIHDALGRIVKHEELASSTQQVSVADLPNGMYTYTVAQNSVRQVSGKLVIAK